MPRRRRPALPPPMPEDHSPVPPAAPGPRTPRERSLALMLAASVLAASSLGMGGRPPRTPEPRAPACPPGGTVSWDDTDGCWERRSDGTRNFRTSSRGRVFWSSTPPQGSRYYTGRSSGWSWFRSSSSSSSTYRGSSSVGG